MRTRASDRGCSDWKALAPRRRLSLGVAIGIEIVAAAGIVACGTGEREAPTVRLVDVFAEARVEGSPPAGPAPEPIEWRWDGEARPDVVGDAGGADEAADGTLGWKAIHGIDGLGVRDGRLVGTTTDDAVLLAVQVPEDLLPDDLLHAAQIRMRATAGTRVGVGFSQSEEPKWEGWIEEAKDSSNAPLMTSLIADGEMRTYTLTAADSSFDPSFHLGEVRHLVLTPVEVAGADFAIESVRLVSRKEHLTSIESGPGWHGLGEIYREAIDRKSVV